MVRAILLVALVVMGHALSARAQQRSAYDFVPEVEEFGDGWVVVAEEPVLDQEGVESAAQATYAGPSGSRVYVLAYVTESGAAAIRRGWELANEIFDNSRFRFDYDYGSEQDAEALRPPTGCSDARRTSGGDYAFGPAFPAGLTLCAADPDVIVFAVVSGKVLGETGIAASDAVVSMMIGNAIPVA